MKVVAIIQARCGSSRFPNKVFADICGKPLIEHVVDRLKFAKTLDEIVLATTTETIDDKLYDWGVHHAIIVYRGNQNDVLNRYYQAAKAVKADVIVRITADDPFKEPQLIDMTVQKLQYESADFVSNNNPPTYPEGLDVEVFTMEALEVAEGNSKSDFEREHVTQYFYHNPSNFKILNISQPTDLSYLRWTIDTEIDLAMVKKVYSELYQNDGIIFHFEDILNLLKEYPWIAEMNLGVERSEMYKSK